MGSTKQNVQKGAREAAPLKKNIAVLWPRRGRRGLRQHCDKILRRPPQIVVPQPLLGSGVWSAASAYQRRPGSTGSIRKGIQSCEAKPSRVGAYKPVAEGGIVALELSTSGPNRGKPGAPGDRRQLHREKSSSSAVPPFVRPIASEYPPTLGSHGVPQWDRGDDTDKMEPERPEGKIATIWRYDAPKGDCRGRARGFPLRFPTSRVGFILHTPSQS